MCYYVESKLTSYQLRDLEHEYVVNWEEESTDDFYAVSGFSHPKLPIITSEKSFKKYRWGLIPHWVKDWDGAKKIRIQTLNCIGEEAETKPSFRDAIKQGQFCIIPLNGFFEWHHFNDQKYPHFIYPKDKSLFLTAGIFNQWTNKAITEVHNTFTICTVKANERMEWIHNSKKRMPLILSKEESKIWLDKEVPFAEKKKLINPYEVDLMADHPISKLITSRKENSNVAAVTEPFDYPELALS